MEKELIFGIDIDGVLRDSIKEMVKIYNDEIGDNMKYSDVKEYYVSKSFPRIEEETGISATEWFFDVHSREIFFGSKPIKGAKKAIEKLKKYGKVIIITYQRTCQNKMDTLEWLCKNKLMVDDVLFLKDKGIVHCDYHVDDCPDYFKDSMSDNFVLINAPYNSQWKCDTDDKKVYRVNSLVEFADMIEKNYNAK